MRKISSRLAIALLAVASLANATARAQNVENVFLDLDRKCGPVRETTTAEGAADYRLRESSAVVAFSLRQLDNFHTNPAVKEFAAKGANRNVKADLNFTLQGSPNHQKALRLLVQYDLAGGKTWEFARTECYFSWARQYAPDDTQVHVIAGYYFWKKGTREDAEVWWRRAIQLEPASADANYNLGLLYFEKGDYTTSLHHARVAYAAGYPLPALRDKLKKAGHWVAATN